MRCSCGSGLYREEVYDARGIFITFCCEACKSERLAGYRPEIFTDPGYDTIESIEED